MDGLDVRVVNDADSVFLGNLLREGRRCFERDLESRVAFEVQATNSWLDFQPAWDRLRRLVLEVGLVGEAHLVMLAKTAPLRAFHVIVARELAAGP
ncbi:MAG: hypothetical protein ABIP94_21215 [Planctomycetota bacterium]